MKKNWKLFIFIILIVVIANTLGSKLKINKEALYPKNNNIIEKTEEPEQVIGTLMLGGFRIFVSDLLWLRMVTLEESGSNHELILTANLIATLQPTYTSVWEYLAFVLSNNISSKESDPQLKLEWVKSAIDYLYKGIKRNPDNGMLYVAMGRTVNEKLGIYKERMLDHYFIMRNEGNNPHEMARQNLLEAIKTNNYTVYAERELFIVNSYWVKEALFHLRNKLKKHCLLAHAILNNESEENIKKLQVDCNDYISKFGKEGTLDEVAYRIKVAVETLQENNIKYPDQTDFQFALEQHTEVYIDIFSRAKILTDYDTEMEKMIKNGRQNLSEDVLSIDLLEIEIKLLRINILECEYFDDKGKTVISLLNEISEKIKKIKEKKAIDEPQK